MWVATRYFITLVKTDGGLARHSKSYLAQWVSRFETHLQDAGQSDERDELERTGVMCVAYCLLGHLYRAVLGDVDGEISSFEVALNLHPCDSARINLESAHARCKSAPPD